MFVSEVTASVFILSRTELKILNIMFSSFYI